MDACLETLMSDTVVVTAQSAGSTASLYGVPTYAASASTYACYHERVRREIRDAQGQNVAASGTLFVSSTTLIHPQSKVTLSDGSTPPVLYVDTFQDQFGTYGSVIYLGAV